MTSPNTAYSDVATIPEAAFHGYGTAEELPFEFSTIQPSGDPTENYRLAFGLYCTGESGVWTLSVEHLRKFLELKSSGEKFPLTTLFEILTAERTGPTLTPQSMRRAEELLERIRARRRAIEAHRGMLSESYLLIREDRER